MFHSHCVPHIWNLVLKFVPKFKKYNWQDTSSVKRRFIIEYEIRKRKTGKRRKIKLLLQICSAIYSVIFLSRNTLNKSLEGSRKFSSASKADDIHVQYLKAYISHSDSKNICLLINRIQYRETKRRFLLNIITTSKINMASVTVNLIKTTNKYFSVFRISCALKKRWFQILHTGGGYVIVIKLHSLY